MGDGNGKARVETGILAISIARVTSAAEWERLTAETRGLVDEELLYVAVDWLQRDAQQVW